MTLILTWQKDLVDRLGYDKLQAFQAGLGQEFSADNAFQTGKVAMNLDGEYRTAFIDDQAPDLNYGTAPFPTADDSRPTATAPATSPATSSASRKGSKNPEAGLGAASST